MTALVARVAPGMEQIPEVLEWRDEAESRSVYSQYLDFISEALTAVLTSGHPRKVERRRQIAERITSLPSESLLRLVLAPLTTAHLLVRPDGVQGAIRHLDDASHVELARLGQRPPTKRALWSALGDIVLLPGGDVVAGPTLGGFDAVDFDSPRALTDDDGNRARSGISRTMGSDRYVALTRIGQARFAIKRTSPIVDRFVSRFTKALVVQTRQGKGFSSGSNGCYIGQTLLANAHQDPIDEADIADALVHEAIHGLLYMQEARVSWVVNDALRAADRRIVSPWTGTKLPVRQFLQACFVWYGLVHFWGLAWTTGAFAPDRVRARLTLATSGFLFEDLVDTLVGMCGDGIAPTIVNAICEMQGVVRRSFAESA